MVEYKDDGARNASRMNDDANEGRTKHKRDVFHAWMVRDAYFVGEFDVPALEPVDACPKKLIPFSVAMSHACDDFGAFVHFYEDDFRFERLWNNPRAYLSRLKKFAGVVMPDYSTCVDFPLALKIWNEYRNFALASWMQREGLIVIPNARCEPGSDSWSLEPIPKNSTIAVGFRSCIKGREDHRRLEQDFYHAVDYCRPRRVAAYGADPQGFLDYAKDHGAEVVIFPGRGRGELGGGF